jgi:peptidoglycan/xylan/chitin deacetylase (PgdA/CDA1 family)
MFSRDSAQTTEARRLAAATRGRVVVARRRAAVVVAALVLVLLGVAALAWGCGGSGGGNSAQASYNLFKDLSAKLIAQYKIPDEGLIEGGKLITYKSNLRGCLPPVKPVVVTKGNPNLKRVALTIDDGWNADMRILDLLKTWKIKFTTFLIGGRGVVDAHPEFVRAIKAGGGEVCSHTWDHYVMRGKDEATVMMEIWQTQNEITGITHQVYPYIRFSGGAYDQPALDWTAREGFWVVNWSVTDNDTAANPTVDSQVNALLAGVQPGAIMLCHWGGHNTYDVLARAIPEIQKRGYEVTSLSRVLEGTPYYLKGSTGTGANKSGTQ